MSIDQIFDVCFLCCFEWSSQISGTKKRMFRWHGSCSTCFIKTGNPVFPVKSKVSNPSCNVFHFPPCFPIKPWTGWKSEWCIFIILEMIFFFFMFNHVCEKIEGGNIESINILISVQHRLTADWSEATIPSFILSYLYCENIWENQIFLPHISKELWPRAKWTFKINVCTNSHNLVEPPNPFRLMIVLQDLL